MTTTAPRKERSTHRDPLNVYLGRHLRTAREARGLYQIHVAEALGVHPETYSLYETGRNRMNMKLFLQTCLIIDADPLAIINDVMTNAHRLIGTVPTLERRS